MRFLQCGLHWGHGSRIDAGGRVKDDTGDEFEGRRSIALALHFSNTHG